MSTHIPHVQTIARRLRTRGGLAVVALAFAPLLILGSGTPAFAASCDGIWRVATGPSLPLGLADVAAPGSGELWTISSIRDANYVTRPVISHRVRGVWHTAAFAAWSRFKAIAAVPGTAWVIGSDSADNPLAMRWDGNGWRVQHIASAGSALTSVTMRSNKDVWISGTQADGLLVLHYDGSTWRHWLLPPVAGASALWTIADHTAKDAWLFGMVPGTVSYIPGVWHWNGTSWRQQHIPGQFGGLDTGLFAADVTATGTVWAAGWSDAGDCCHTYALVARHSSQTGWSTFQPSVRLPGGFSSSLWTPTDVVASDAPGGTTVVGSYFFGDSGGGVFYPVIATWNGHKWATQSIRGMPTGATGQLLAVDGDDHGDRWAVGQGPTGGPLLVHQCVI